MGNLGRMLVPCEKNLVIMALCGLLLSSVGVQCAQAEKLLKSPDEPIEIKLSQTLDPRHFHQGDPFEATVTETYRLGERELPAGTIVKGEVRGGHASMILGMPGYVALNIQEAVLPSGTVYHFEKDDDGLKTKKYHNPKAHTGKSLLRAAIPFSAVSTLDAIPLKYAAGMGFWQIAPISLAARMALGVGLEMSEKHRSLKNKKYPTQTRVGYGMLRGTGLTGVYRSITRSPEPDLKEGAVIAVHLPKKHMTKLFEAGDAVKTVEASPAEIPVAGTEDLKPVEIESQSFETVHGSLPGKLSTQAVEPASVEQPAAEASQ